MINKEIIRAKSALRRLKSKKGQTLVEYALILAFISVVAISVLIALGNQVKGVFTTINSQLETQTNSPDQTDQSSNTAPSPGSNDQSTNAAPAAPAPDSSTN